MSLAVYNILIRLYGFSIFIASPFSAKAKLWVQGRRNLYRDLEKISGKSGKRVWFHCASLGEFEQARPLIELIKLKTPDIIIILSFFSPSGYEVRKNYRQADLVLYLPLDTEANAREFIENIKPNVALFVKYEFWYNYLAALKRKGIPIILFSSVFRKQQVFFRWYGGFFRKMLQMFDKIFVQNKESQELLQGIGVKSEIAPDTRFDRVYQVFSEKRDFPAVKKFKEGYRLLIAGSTWKSDEKLISQLINNKQLSGYKYIIAPHEPGKGALERLEKNLHFQCSRFSQLSDENAGETDVVLVDTMGDLSALYAYGDIAYVGGGFDQGVHNILECAVYDLPVIFGPHYKKSEEAKELVATQVAFFVTDYDQLLIITERINASNSASLRRSYGMAAQYVLDRLGGTDRIYQQLLNLL